MASEDIQVLTPRTCECLCRYRRVCVCARTRACVPLRAVSAWHMVIAQ